MITLAQNMLKIGPAVNADRAREEEAMPHVIVEYSANIEAELPPSRLVEEIHQAAMASGIAEPVAIRTRLMRREHYRVGDGSPENAFVHIDIRARRGRTLEQKKAAVQAIYDQANKTLDPVFKARPLALTVEIHEIDPDTRLLRNGMRERGAAAGKANAA
jgi:5-carboxymethyl-2-hydroxymuconate isomerase